MKLSRVFLIGSALILSAIIYVSLAEKHLDETQIAKLAMPTDAKLAIHGASVKNGDLDAKLQANVTSLGKEVAQLRAELLALRADMQVQKSKSVSSSVSAVDNQTKIGSSREQIVAREEERLRKQGEVLEAGFRQQTTDPQWSEKTKTLVQKALTSDNISSKDVVDIECRASMCRVELTHDGKTQAPKLSEFPVQISEELPNILANQINESDGSTTTVLYLSKDDLASSNAGS